jgi:hypothetical protein
MPRPDWRTKSIHAAEIVLNAFPSESPETAEALASLRRFLVELYEEAGDYSSAAHHTGALLRHSTRRYARDLRALIRIACKAKWPTLWASAQKVRRPASSPPTGGRSG